MKSNKQRRAEIKQLRLARAARAQARLRETGSDGRLPTGVPGAEPADVTVLARHTPSPGYGGWPAFYVDRPFRCRDCGADEVWTAKQQKWWFETVGANLNSSAARCLACRRARRAALRLARSAPGATRVGDEVAWLRAVGAGAPDAQTERRVEDALASKWDGVRKVAIDVLGRWRRPVDAPRLRAWAEDDSAPWYSGPRQAAARALASLLRHPQDDAWVLEAFASARVVTWPWGDFVHGMPMATLDAFVHRELDAGDARRLENLCLMLLRAHRLPSAPVVRRLLAHPARGVSTMARHAVAACDALVPLR